MDYRGYWISTGEYGEVRFWIGDEDNYDASYEEGRWVDNAHHADSIEDAKQQIDDLIFESTSYEVSTEEKVFGHTIEYTTFFQWLSEAVDFAVRNNGVLKNQFNAM